MPFYIKSSFSFTCPVDRSAKKDVERSLANDVATITLLHEKSRSGTWIAPSDCVKGAIKLTFDGSQITVEADFTAKTKFKAADIAEFAEYGGDWQFGGVRIKTADGSDLPIRLAGGKEPVVRVEISDKK